MREPRLTLVVFTPFFPLTMLVPTLFYTFAALSLLTVSRAHTPNSRFEHRRHSFVEVERFDFEKRVPNLGRYDFMVPGYSVTLMSTVGINGKVYFMDKKYDPGNTTGAYELDPSLVNNPDWTTAWREMHVLDEIFCSASIILPDKTGRILNIAGWSDAANFGIRLLTPDGSFGVQGTKDWEQDPTNIVLQRPRWYPTALTLSNGSILVVGGTDTESGNAQPNLEILPRIPGGDTTVYLDFLAQTHPWNLYPFLFVLSTGNVFIGYFNQARVLDKTTFNTVTTLPMIPGPSAGVFTAGRTYPWSGAAVLMPIVAPYNTPMTVMICGGSNYDTRVGLDTCVSIKPETPHPTWAIEQMPSKRVLACIASLADGTFLIINGAHLGSAGFANAQEPNYAPVVYDPALPFGSRMTELASTNIARLYHSEATLLLDGSVIVSGSDPQDPNFPQEYRHERFSPPYMLLTQIRPSFTLAVKDWAYKGGYQIVLKGSASKNMKIVLVGAQSSTHGNTMSTRTVLPSMKCTGFGCTVYAPTNAQVCPPGWFMIFVLDGARPSLGQWVRIGGDPAQLGNWPPGPFTRPGV